MSLPEAAPPAATDVLASGMGELLFATAGTVQRLLEQCAPDDPIRVQLQQIHHTLQRLAAMTGQLNQLGRRSRASATPLDLNTVVRHLAPALQRLLGPFISLNTSLHAAGAWVAGDRNQLEQVLLGLVVNAREALPLGGVVCVATRVLTVTETMSFRVGELSAGEWALLEVRDNGATVDDRAVHHLLEPSLRGLPFDSSLSLSTVSTIVRDTGGRVVLDTTRRDGTMLAACFPATTRARQRRTEPPTAVAILIADDDEWTRLSLTRILRRAGFGVLEAEHGDAAIELLDDVAGSCVRLVIAAGRLRCQNARLLVDRLRDERPDVTVITLHDDPAVPARRRRDIRLRRPAAATDVLRLVREQMPAGL